MTSTGSPSSLLAQARPPNPAPTITTRGRPPPRPSPASGGGNLTSAIGHDAELCMGLPQRGLDGGPRGGAREHEAEIALTLRPPHQRLPPTACGPHTGGRHRLARLP